MTQTKFTVFALYLLGVIVSVALLNNALAGELFASTAKVDKTLLKLVGRGVRKASFFQVKVYEAALYAERKSDDYLNLSRNGLEMIEMHFDRDVSADDSRKVWAESLKTACGQPCNVDFSEFLKAVTDIKAGQSHRYTFYEDRVLVEQAAKTKEFKEKGLSLLLLKTWIGDHPPTEELKAGLLGQ